MKPWKLGIFLAISIVAVDGLVWAQDPSAIVAKRQDVMKRQGRNIGIVRDFLQGKADSAAAMTAANDLTVTTSELPSLFPKGTSSAELPGNSNAKPNIWTEPDKFSAAQQNARTKAMELAQSLKTDDKTATSAAFDAIIKGGLSDSGNACGGCHVPFRERKS
jgi:cytochrome c556